jgi:hypothetical protein
MPFSRIGSRDGQDRMLILPGEDADNSTSAGRPIGSEYWDRCRKLAFIDRWTSRPAWPQPGRSTQI